MHHNVYSPHMLLGLNMHIQPGVARNLQHAHALPCIPPSSVVGPTHTRLTLGRGGVVRGMQLMRWFAERGSRAYLSHAVKLALNSVCALALILASMRLYMHCRKSEGPPSDHRCPLSMGAHPLQAYRILTACTGRPPGPVTLRPS